MIGRTLCRLLVPVFLFAGILQPGRAVDLEPPRAVPEVAQVRRVSFQGGSPDDVALARAAAALPEPGGIKDSTFQTALAAIRATDRFRTVAGRLGPEEAWIRLDPWPSLARIVLEGLPKREAWGLRVGDRVGSLRLEAWRLQVQQRLVEGGYPAAQVTVARTRADTGLRVAGVLGKLALVEGVAVSGAIAPYTEARLLRIAKLVPGRTIWTEAVQRACLGRLKAKLMKDQRLESSVALTWADGLVTLTLSAGPEVRLRAEGDRLGWNVSLGKVLSLTRTERYSAETLEEGDRKLVRYLRQAGYLDAQGWHRREVVRDGPAGSEKVVVTYTIRKGERKRVREVRFEGNRELAEAELLKAASLPSALRGTVVTPALMEGLAGRVKALYQSRGYAKARVRVHLTPTGADRPALLCRIQEGARRTLRWLELELPRGGFGDPWGLGEGLALVLSDPPRRVSMGPPRGYASQVDPLTQGLLALRETPGEDGGVVLTLTLSQAIPLVKADLAKVATLLRQRWLPALGVLSPVVRLTLKDSDEGTGAQFRVLDQPQEQVQRLVVRGANQTRARAVLRALRLEPGTILDPAALAEAQARLNGLGAFRWTGLSGLPNPQGGEADGLVPPTPWQQGDLLLDLKERPPWGVTSFFGYDATQGYYLGSGVQWLNVGGMGRTIDLGLRAGDHTIGNPTLRKWFPTGAYPNSIDALSLGYQDPWFAPPALGAWLPEPTRFSMAVALIEQEQALYLLNKRRFITSLQWNLTPSLAFQAGYRLEQVAVTSGVAGIDSTMLAHLSRYPARAIFSAPFVQLTRDTRDSSLDPTRGSYSMARLELANQLFLTSPENSFVKLDLRQQWNWPLSAKAAAGVVTLGLRVGVAKPTAPSASNLPLSERFFGGGPFTQRCVVPDGLGPLAQVPVVDRHTKAVLPGQFRTIPVGGQGLAILNLEYRFPIFARRVWGELFLDSGQIYESLGGPRAQTETPAFPPLRTSLGLGLIFKFGFPLKLEYGGDLNRILGRPRSATDEATQQKGVVFSIGYQF